MTFRAGSQQITNIKVEDWDVDISDWVEVYNSAPSISENAWLCPQYTAQSSTYFSYKTRFTLSGSNPLSADLYIQRIIMYHSSANWNSFYVHKGGDIIYGNLDVVGLVQCDSFRIDQTPTAGTFTPDKYVTINCNGTSYKVACLAA